MSLLFRFLFKEYLKTFLLLLLLFLFFFLVIDFFERLPPFLKAKKPLIYLLEYFFWKIPLNLYQFYPFVLPLASLLSLFFLSRTRELLALISLGFPRREIYQKYLLILLILSLPLGLLLNYLAPRAYFKALYTWDTKIEGRQAQHLIFKETLFFEGKDFLLIATPLEPKGEYLADLTLIFLEEETPKTLFWAKRAIYQGDNLWQLEEAVLQEKKEEFKPRLYKVWQGKLPLRPKTYVVVEKSVKFASLKELKERYHFLRKVGKPVLEVLSELLNRFISLLGAFLLGTLPLYLYLKTFAPHQMGASLLKGLLSFLGMSTLFIISQTLLFKALWLSLLLFILFITFNLFISRRSL